MRERSTRREFLASAAAITAFAPLATTLGYAGTGEQSLESRLARDPRRPQFHLLPAKNWMNDPNGPIYFGGRYHMFFQYNPLAAVWGDMSWNHAVSADMLHWTLLPVALTPTPDSPDSFGCFSGSAIQVGSRVYQVYTGTRVGPKDLATIKDGQDTIQESQCIAWSDDPKLIHWTKLPVPIVPLPPAGMKIVGFRDPSVWKQGEWYYMTVGSGEAGVGGCVLLYRSKEMRDPAGWTYLHKLTSGQWTGAKTANPCDDGEMWECPELFPLGDGHVLIYSTLGKVFWQSGRLDLETMRFTPSKTGELDLGAFYAPKTQLDRQGRRILWGWIQERRTDEEMKAAGWSGMMSLPRVLTLDPDGVLRIRVLPEARALRAGATVVSSLDKDQTTVLQAANGEVLVTGHRGSGFEFTLRGAEAELLHVVYEPMPHRFLVDGKTFALEADDLPTLHAFVDGSVIELIVAERIGYTKRFYYPGDTAPAITVDLSGDGARLEGWKVAPISTNRLTTPSSS